MFLRLLLVIAITALAACTPAKMEVDPRLNNGFEVLTITEKPKLLSEAKLAFGPYKADQIDRDWTTSSGTTIGNYKSSSSNKGYAFTLVGEQQWKAECLKEGESTSLSQGSIEISSNKMSLNCRFTPSEGAEENQFTFHLSGPDLVGAKGTFQTESKEIRVSVSTSLADSSFKMGMPMGYYFHTGEELIAGVDAISENGPVWLSESLSTTEKNQIALVVMALLLI